ncbi:hypothetical protein PQE66_gp011 [Bacillus phage PBC2]|uniref:Uncharacterized protein n=1 Tax=Bacillus phage PBC2 TaxID=1675029 RepID=A0A218KBQ9_9CAUD|nr:hypothetical protein PQE66_gp011 [Bacillus phage PBC2]AKQ08326.1 hypothetical protein PBC2_011 [Bacillus phage PBC2]
MEIKMDWLIFPITENGKTSYYMTNAPILTITNAYNLARNVNDFIEILQELNFDIGKYYPSVQLNFDE